jgi:coenzyme Q-binding protein COQ10
MAHFEAARRVDHPAERMFDLVADCGSYPEFVPHCEQLTVTGRGEENGKPVLVAEMTVAYGAMRETFTTRDVMDRDALVIDVVYLDGPFRRFESHWRFEPIGADTSVVHFSADYELRSRILSAIVGPIITRSFDEIIAAFEQRADALYARAV